MYIKRVVKQTPGSKKRYQYLHLVESIRTRKGPRQRLVLNLGNPDIPKEKFRELAGCIESILAGQNQLFCLDPIIEKHAKKAARSILEKRSRDAAMEKVSVACSQSDSPLFEHVDINSVGAGTLRSVGPEYVCHSVWKELGIDGVLVSGGVAEGNLPILKALVIGRLVEPGSERHTRSWAEDRSALYELTGKPVSGSLNSYYRGGDTLFKCKHALEAHLSAREKELFDLPERMWYRPGKRIRT